MNCRSLVLATIVAICLLVPSGCKEVSHAYVHLDNGHDRPVSVFVDGIYAGQVKSGHSRRLTLTLGRHEFLVKDDRNVLYSAAHRLDSGNRPYRTPVFVLNPDGNNRYCELELATLPSESGERDARLTLTSLQDESPKNQPIVMIPASVPQPRPAGGSIDAPPGSDIDIAAEYQTIAERILLQSPNTFFKVKRAEHQFGPIPAAALSSEEAESRPSALARIPSTLHRYLREALTVEQPTRHDLNILQQAESAAIACIPVR